MRILLIAVLAALAPALMGALPAAGGPPPVGLSQYLVEPDPRLCPSPLCGGYWASLANHSQTRCHDGVLRPRCYVAVALDEQRHQLETGVPAGAIVRADIEPWRFEGFGQLGALVVAAVRAPVGQKATGSVYRVKDLGIRCVRAPCFSFRAGKLNTLFRTTLSSLNLRPAFLTAEDRARTEAALETTNGLFASGRVVRTADGGRELRVWRVYLRAAPLRG